MGPQQQLQPFAYLSYEEEKKLDYGFKPTTSGRALIAKCAALEKPLILTRVSVGSGRVPEGANLADIHELVQYVADGTIEHRRHKDNRFSFTVQYVNEEHPEVGTFYLSEFIVFAKDPEDGAEVDILYATMGDYIQPVPKWSPEWPPSVWNFPVTLIVSDEIEVKVDTPSGLVTYEDLQEEVHEACEEIGGLFRTLNLTIPTSGWVLSAEPDYDHIFECDVSHPDIRAALIPMGTAALGQFRTARRAGMVDGCETFDGYIRFYAKRVPKEDIRVCVHLFRMGRTAQGALPEDYIVSGDEETNEMLEGVFSS